MVALIQTPNFWRKLQKYFNFTIILLINVLTQDQLSFNFLFKNFQVKNVEKP